MAHRSIGQERFGFAGRAGASSTLDELGKLIDWMSVAAVLDPLYCAAKGDTRAHRVRQISQAAGRA